MKRTEDKGVTLVALVTTIVLILILASIGATAGMSTINWANFSQFKNELKVLQTKVNELNQNNEIDIGQQLNEEQKSILNNSTIYNIIYNGASEEEKVKIQDGFRYCDREYIRKNFNLDNVKRDYLINVEYRYVIYYQGFEYDGKTYYMLEQMGDGLYNVKYNDKNPKDPKEGDFDVNYTKENDRWKIEISNIIYTGYINNWQVEYRLDGESKWKKVNGLNFYVTKAGNYYVQVSHDDINLGSKLVSIIDETNKIDENIVDENVVDENITDGNIVEGNSIE